MRKRKCKSLPRHDYIENVQRDGMRVAWRSKVTAWLLEFEEEFAISPDTIAVAVNFMDRYLSTTSTQKGIVQLLAMGAIFIASKIHETENPIGMTELRDLADGEYLESDIKLMELELLRVIQWKLNPVTPQSFMNHFMQYVACENDRKILHEDAVTFLDIIIPEYIFLRYPPSVQATAAMLCAFHMTGKCSKKWEQSMAKYGLLQNPSVAECKTRMWEMFEIINQMCPQSSMMSSQEMERFNANNSPTGVADMQHEDLETSFYFYNVGSSPSAQNENWIGHQKSSDDSIIQTSGGCETLNHESTTSNHIKPVAMYRNSSAPAQFFQSRCRSSTQ
mmetsp:Transcript_25545/g.55387  ORF Transcript_25545/g.55387 Transcript_25545/m.55387 type:complete len:334 (-) Transcript_25545:828-1829(-)